MSLTNFHERQSPADDRSVTTPGIEVVTDSGADGATQDLADLVRSGLASLGSAASPMPAGACGAPPVVVQVGPTTSPADDLARTLLVATALPGTPAWDAERRLARCVGSVYHVAAGGVRALRAAGIGAERFVALREPWLEPTLLRGESRHDLAVLAERTPRRARLVAEQAHRLARHDVELHLWEADDVRRPGTAERLRVLEVTTALLELRATGASGLDWTRAGEALASGAVLLTEAHDDLAPLVPGVHVLTAAPEATGLLLERALADGARLAEVRAAAFELLAAERPLTRSLEQLVASCAALAKRAGRGRPVEAHAGSAGSPEVGRHADASPPHAELHELVRRQGAVLKRLHGEVRTLRRRVARLEHERDRPGEPLDVTVTTPAFGGPADVTVMVTVHNYERFVTAALHSVLRSEGLHVEIVVVDDASVDASAERVEDVMREHPEVPMALVRRRVNGGASAGRNLAARLAHAPFLFVLDADNELHPRGLAKLREALLADPQAGFAYGLVERFGEATEPGLMGTRGWDPALLAREHYIDMMALVRADAFHAVGGFVTDPRLELGWEDYDLWLSLAGRGWSAAHVRQIVGRYRVHGVSALMVTTLDTTELRARLRERHVAFFEAFDPAGGGTDR